jgi:hypothetical protein
MQSASASKTVQVWRARMRTHLTLESGAEVIVRKPGLGIFVGNGRLPLSLAAKVAKKAVDEKPADLLKADEEENAATKPLTDEGFSSFAAFAKAMVTEVLVEPRVYVREEGDETPIQDDETYIQDIPPDDFMEIYQWGCSQQGSMKVAGKEVGVEQMGHFRPDEEIPVAGSDDGAVRDPDVSVSANAG